MTVQEFLNKGMEIFNFCSVYYTVQLIRCVIVSFPVFALVMILRKTVRDNVFLKGALWVLFLPVLFVGKMKIFYENKVVAMLFLRCQATSVNHIWIGWLYLFVMFIYAASLLFHRKKLGKMVAGMEKRKVEGMTVYVTSMPVTPSTVGVIQPKIIMPEVVLKEYDREEFQIILLHEKIHIRLGHLVFYLLWDILRVLLWLNPLLTVGTRYFREDMEEICDWVTIQRSRGNAYSYGQLLLKSMRLLQAEGDDFNLYAAFAGNRRYKNIKQRVIRIAGYKPYKRKAVILVAAATMLCILGTLAGIHNLSYGRANEDRSIFLYGYDSGQVVFFNQSDALSQMISYDEDYVYVERGAFERYLRNHHAQGEIFIVFGGFQKLPGIGGFGYSCMYERDAEEKTARIPYENYKDDWLINLYKFL